MESPNFLLTKDDYLEYRKKTDKFLFNNFYMWSKDKLNILKGIKSQDKLNRQKLPKDIIFHLYLNYHLMIINVLLYNKICRKTFQIIMVRLLTSIIPLLMLLLKNG